MNPDSYILALLSDGPKSFTQLYSKIVLEQKVCAKQTFATHLRNVVKDKKIKKSTNPDDRTTTYSLMPEHESAAKFARDAITLELLIDELKSSGTRRDLSLEEVRPTEKEKADFILGRLLGTENRPKMHLISYMDKDALEALSVTEPVSMFASNLALIIQDKLEEAKLKTTQEQGFFSSPRNWCEIGSFSQQMALRHGLRFLIASWYDGKEYGKGVMSARKNLEKLERDHEQDISFLDEVNRRCFYSSLEYVSGIGFLYEETVSSLLKMHDPYELMEPAFFGFFGFIGSKQGLMWLEAALVSASAAKVFSQDVLKERIRSYWDWRFQGENPETISPYSILSFTAYLRMKLPFISKEQKTAILEVWLTSLASLLENKNNRELMLSSKLCSDYCSHPEDYQLAIKVLLERLIAHKRSETHYEPANLSNIPTPVMNFQFYDKQTKVDFSHEPLVKNFLSLTKNPEKRKWLQKCLSLGLPVFHSIPFDKLGFEVKNIL